MLIDFQDLAHDAEIVTDVCVIGSGAAGITLATELDGLGHDVVVLAGGPASHAAESQDLYQSDVVGLRHGGIHGGRARVLGGTTTLWAGQALPLDASDFEPRDWVPDSGWPFRREALEPYYRRAERVLKLPTMTYDERSWPPNRPLPPRFDPSVFHCLISQFSPAPNFAASYRAELARSANVRVLLDAHAVGLVTDAARTRLERVEVKALSGRSATVRPRHVVVSCGAIETARLLLASDCVDPRGVGNAHDLVGRYFQDHIQGRMAVFRATRPRLMGKMFDPFAYRKTRYSPKICTSEALQRKERILNYFLGPCYEIPEDSPLISAKLLVHALKRKDLRPQVPRALWNVARRPHEVALSAVKYALFDEPLTPRGGPMYLGIQGEQAPNPRSRVTLGEGRDALGMRRTVLDWRLTDLDRRSILTLMEYADREFRRLGLGTVEFSPSSIPEDLSRMDRAIHDVSHHIGTTRMHDDPRFGVVDRDCRVHGIDNLSIGSSAVFPTGGASNPTMTIIALCLRIADRLRADLAARPATLAAPSPSIASTTSP